MQSIWIGIAKRSYKLTKSYLENTALIARMTSEDRQELNRIVKHKREEFEGVIQKGVVAMLNA
jgi:hypothetical protein